jgi:hypothetical protein
MLLGDVILFTLWCSALAGLTRIMFKGMEEI